MALETRSIALSLGVFLGLVGSAYIMGKSLKDLRAKAPQVTVKGIGETIVRADLAAWRLAFAVEAPTFTEAITAFNTNAAKINAFLKKYKIQEADITPATPSVTVGTVQNTQGGEVSKNYTIHGAVGVVTQDIDVVTQAAAHAFELLDDQVPIKNDYSSSPRYTLHNFDSVRPALLEEAVKSAKRMAEKFAENTGTQVGHILSANQGSFSIESPRGDYNTEAYPEQKVRVVTHVVYSLDTK